MKALPERFADSDYAYLDKTLVTHAARNKEQRPATNNEQTQLLYDYYNHTRAKAEQDLRLILQARNPLANAQVPPAQGQLAALADVKAAQEKQEKETKQLIALEGDLENAGRLSKPTRVLKELIDNSLVGWCKRQTIANQQQTPGATPQIVVERDRVTGVPVICVDPRDPVWWRPNGHIGIMDQFRMQRAITDPTGATGSATGAGVRQGGAAVPARGKRRRAACQLCLRRRRTKAAK